MSVAFIQPVSFLAALMSYCVVAIRFGCYYIIEVVKIIKLR